jgi:hypothetical protein
MYLSSLNITTASLAVSLCTLNTIICQEKEVLCLGYYVVHYKHAHALLKVNKLFIILTITADDHNVSLLILNNSVLKIMGPTTCAAVMAHHIPNLRSWRGTSTASLMFRAVFWVVLPCKMIVEPVSD